MIESLRIQNFQCHNRLPIELDNVTSIVGPTDSGKSAVIRSLRWLATNTPQGEQFVQEGTKGCTVVVRVDDHEIRRKKGSGLNEYILDGKPLKAFGTGVPDPVKDILRIDQINFQNQHDPPFWFSDTAGQVSRSLNAIVDLDLIDRCLAAVNKAVTKSRLEVSVGTERLEKAVQKRNKLEWVKEALEDLAEVEKIEEAKEEVDDTCKELSYEVEEVLELKEEEELARKIAEELKLILDVGGECGVAKKLEEGLTKTIEEIHRLKAIKRPNIGELETLMARYIPLADRMLGLKSLITAIGAKYREVKETRSVLRKAEQELSSKMGGVCPLCGKKI
jgi:hypothetical protein